jgi:hypothetical protein
MTLTLLQGIVTVVSLQALRAYGIIDFAPFSWATAAKVAPLSFVFISYVVVSLVSLGKVNVPMFTALRRLTILFVMVEEYYLLGISPSSGVVATVGVMTLGCAIAAWKDLTFDLTSYGWLFLTNLFTSLYTVFINTVKRDTGLSVFALLYYNSLVTMPALFALAWYTGDLSRAWAFPYSRNIFFQINFQASIFLAFLLNLSTFYCSTLNSARTLSVVGQLKNVIAFILGLVLFNDYVFEPYNFAGLWVGFAGSVWYTYVTYAEKASGGASKKVEVALGPAAESGARALHLPGSAAADGESTVAVDSLVLKEGDSRAR